MTKHVYQKKKKKLLKLVICDDSREEDVVPESLIHDAESSPVQNSLVKSNAETTVNIDDFAETSVEDTTIHRGDSMKVSTPVKTIFTSPEVSNTESFHEEVQTSGITVNVSDMGANVNMGDRVSNNKDFQDQKEEHNNDDDEFDGTFADIELDPDEENISDNMLLTGKQFKILNRKVNSLLKLQADGGGENYVSSLEVDILLKRQENRLLDAITDADRQNEKRMKAQSMSFTSNLKYLKAIVKEGHILFIQDVKKVREDVNLKIQELREDIGKEVSALQHDYSSLHQKFDIIADVVTKFVKLYESLVPKVAKTADTDVQSFANIN
ncbi:unnamed protein product [Lactuca saligna]|uniref:Uncharacterized protein n=1 Tax=Lactuca saligna TaxID=75948 RepID=A0AA35ZB12_LACSI|nr:unnamed protein product [Lactuca saligna]